jgi:hypothetical protein
MGGQLLALTGMVRRMTNDQIVDSDVNSDGFIAFTRSIDERSRSTRSKYCAKRKRYYRKSGADRTSFQRLLGRLRRWVVNLGTSVGRSTATPSTSTSNRLYPALDAYIVLTFTGSEQRERPSKSDGERLVDNLTVNIRAIANLRSHYRAYFETDVRRYTVLDAVRPTIHSVDLSISLISSLPFPF